MKKLDFSFVAYVQDDEAASLLEVRDRPNIWGPIPVWVNGVKVVFNLQDYENSTFHQNLVKETLKHS